jgi:phospholipase/carboxylesterase
MSTTPPIELQSGPNPTASLIVLHGLGADGNDFVPVCQALDLSALGCDVRCVLPHADEIPVTINGGYVMRAWYDIRTGDLTQREDEAGLRRSQAVVQALVEREIARGVPAGRIVLMGFSQGCAMTLMTGLRCPVRLGGLVGLSGYLPLLDRTAAERHAANLATPIFLAHGGDDGVVPIARAVASRDALQALGHTVQWQEYAMEHSVCMEEIADLNRWLLQVLAG